MRKSMLWMILATAGLMLTTSPAKASLFDAALAPIAKLTLGSFLGQVDDTAKDVINDASNKADGLVVTTANQANLFATNISLEYANNLNTTIEDLNQQQQQVVARLQQAQIQLNNWTTQAYNLRDTSVVDVTQLEANLPITHVAEFQVLDVNGTSYLSHGSGDYKLSLHAYGVGISSDRTTIIKVSLNGKDLPIQDPDQTSAGVAIITLPGSAITPLFDPTKLVNPELVISVSITGKGFLGTGLFRKTESFKVPVYLNLYPDTAGSVVVHATYPTYDWVDVEPAYGSQITTPNKDGCKGGSCEATNTVYVSVNGPTSGPPILGAERITKLWLDCTSHNSICNFVDSVNPVVSLNDTFGTITFNTNSLPVNFRADANVQEYSQTGVATSDVAGELSFTKQTEFVVPNAANLTTLSFVSFGGLAYDMVIPGADTNGIVNYISRTANAGGIGQDVILLGGIPPSGL